MRRWDIDLVRQFVIENSDCKLLSEDYKNTTTPLEFKCECGNEFKTIWKLFSSSKYKKRHCNPCGQRRSNAGQTYTVEQVQGFVARHGVTLLSEEYLNCKTELLFRCECGKEFETTFDYMKNGSRIKCFVCQPKEGNLFSKGMDTYNKKTHKKFISDFALKQDGEYEILGEYIDCKTGIATKHNCGYVWYPKPDKLLNSENRCPECYSHRNSHLTNDIQKWLDEKSVIYEKEYWFEDCRNQKPLPFDFAVFENDELKMLIEADGHQHFEPFRYIKDLKKREESFRLTRKRDSIKNEYCKKNSIPLLRIPYFDIDNVNEILSNAMLIPSQASENK